MEANPNIFYQPRNAFRGYWLLFAIAGIAWIISLLKPEIDRRKTDPREQRFQAALWSWIVMFGLGVIVAKLANFEAQLRYAAENLQHEAEKEQTGPKIIDGVFLPQKVQENDEL